MEHHRRQEEGLPERKGQKRKLEEEIEEERQISVPSGDARQALLAEVGAQVNILNSTFSWKEADRAAAKRATHVLAELAKNGMYIRSRRICEFSSLWKFPDFALLHNYEFLLRFC